MRTIPSMLRVVRLLRAGLVVALVSAVAACGSSPSSSSGSAGQPRLLVVTTTTQVTDFARNVGGDHVDVHAILKANVDPHDFEPSAADLVALSEADVIVKNGVGLESWFDSTIKSAEPRGTIVDASAGVEIREGNGTDEESAGDPHIWHDPTNAKIMATNIAAALAAADPPDATAYRPTWRRISAQLDALDADIAAQIATLTNKKLVTNHDAFGYYVQRYGLDFVGSVIPSFDTQAELSPTDVNDLVAKIRAEGVKAIFTETSLPPKTAEAIATEAGVKVVAGDGRAVRRQPRPAGQRRRHVPEDDGAQHQIDRRQPPLTRPSRRGCRGVAARRAHWRPWRRRSRISATTPWPARRCRRATSSRRRPTVSGSASAGRSSPSGTTSRRPRRCRAQSGRCPRSCRSPQRRRTTTPATRWSPPATPRRCTASPADGSRSASGEASPR